MFSTLNSAVFSDSGNMLGNLYMVEATRADDGGIVVTIRESQMHSDPIEVREYQGSDDLLDRISAVVDRVGMKEWGELPPSQFIALDASTKSIRLAYGCDDPDQLLPTYLSYTFNDELPDGGADAINEIHDLMMACTTQDNLIQEYVERTR